MEADGETKESPASPPEDAPADPVAKLQEELTAEKNRYLYLYAEFDNFKKRAIKERSDLIKFGGEGLAREILGVKDGFERGLANASNLEALTEGLRMVVGEMGRTLERFGIQEIKAVGQKFDPNMHEAMGQGPGENGVVIQEFVKGYTLHGKLLRPAKVIVGNGQTQN
jgi:molecular chaperone GrpE